MTTSAGKLRIPLSAGDIAKWTFLGKPLITEDLASDRLSNPIALGALSPDAISSTAYGPEQVLIELLPQAGPAALDGSQRVVMAQLAWAARHFGQLRRVPCVSVCIASRIRVDAEAAVKFDRPNA